MAPTVCLSELPTARSTVNDPYSRRRRRVRNAGGIDEHWRVESRRALVRVASPETPRWEAEEPYDLSLPDVSSSAKISAEVDERWRIVLARREGLLAIVLRTMALVRRNYILQQKVNALRAETRSFIRSVLNNPENRHRRQRLLGPASSEDTCELSSNCHDFEQEDADDTSSDESEASTCSA